VHPEKGVHLLVEAFGALACTVCADWKLMIVGPTEEKLGGGGGSYLASLQELAKACPDRIIFTGPVFGIPELEEKLRCARLFVYPSLADRGESFGLAPLEAMAQGCAVLVSELACFRDFIENGVTGFTFDHRSETPAKTLTTTIQGLLSDETMLARVAAAGYEKSIEYSLPRVADRFLQDFNSVMRDQ
jgi:glycosyltransferase involved in cell wall biosynthesis